MSRAIEIIIKVAVGLFLVVWIGLNLHYLILDPQEDCTWLYDKQLDERICVEGDVSHYNDNYVVLGGAENVYPTKEAK